MATSNFRTLIIDDDVSILNSLKQRLLGYSAVARRRQLLPQVDTLCVAVENRDGIFHFTDVTLRALIDVCKRKAYDYIIIDYAYASKDRQAKQWNEEGAHPEKHASNDHLLTLADLRNEVEAFVRANGGRDSRQIQIFFEQRAALMLRSFQHDRENDKLGSYLSRLETTQAVFPKAARIDQMDSFSLIYNSDPSLREQLYHQSSRGRELYRVVAVTAMLQMYRSALYQSLAERSNRLVLGRSAFSIAMLAILVTTLSGLAGAFVGPIVEAMRDKQWVEMGILSIIALFGIFVGAFAVALIIERGARWIGLRSAGDDS